MNKLILSTALASALAAAGAVSAGPDVEKIEVQADLETIQNYQAAQVWTTLSDDLKTAIAERLVGQLGEDGAEIMIDIDEVSLANNFEAATGLAESSLKGDVKIRIPGMANNENYALTVTAGQVQNYYPAGTDTASLTIGSQVFYDAMVDAFAENVVSKLQ